eukprot:UN00994
MSKPKSMDSNSDINDKSDGIPIMRVMETKSKPVLKQKAQRRMSIDYLNLIEGDYFEEEETQRLRRQRIMNDEI